MQIAEKFNKAFLELLQRLSEEDARFLIVGAFAVAVHAEPRATGDLDIWVEPTAENAIRVFRALRRFGAPLQDLTIGDLATHDVVYQMGLPPNRIDVMTSISGVSFPLAWKRRSSVAVNGLRVPVIGREALVRNKKAIGRPKDRMDLELLKKHAPKVQRRRVPKSEKRVIKRT